MLHICFTLLSNVYQSAGSAHLALSQSAALQFNRESREQYLPARSHNDSLGSFYCLSLVIPEAYLESWGNVSSGSYVE